jgi:DNA-nicking Smr family endonuclease
MKRRRPSKGAPGEASGKPTLPGEDAELWRLTSATVEPLRGAKPRVPDVAAPDVTVRPPGTASDTTKRHDPPDRLPSAPPAPAPPRPGRSLPPPLATFERRKGRRIAAGKISIEARLDLHGLRQSDAHSRLRRFLHQCVADGCSTVLVITGKGGPEAANTHRPFSEDAERPGRGVLRRMVPLWLAEADLRSLVASFRSAGVRHGGEGALYVQLRKRKP